METPSKTIMFAADWCSACKAMKKMINQEKNKEVKDLIEMVDVDSVEGAKAAETFKVNTLPTFVRADGKKIRGQVGMNELRKFVLPKD